MFLRFVFSCKNLIKSGKQWQLTAKTVFSENPRGSKIPSVKPDLIYCLENFTLKFRTKMAECKAIKEKKMNYKNLINEFLSNGKCICPSTQNFSPIFADFIKQIFVLQTPGAFHYRRLISRSTAICINIVSKEVLKTIENYIETYLAVETVILNYNFSASSMFQSWIGRN